MRRKGAPAGDTQMISLIKLSHTLSMVGASAAALTRHSSPTCTRELREGLNALAWVLSGEIQTADTPASKEARRQLRIETAVLLADMETAQDHPTPANRRAVDHRLRAWNGLLRTVRQTHGISLPAQLRRKPSIRVSHSSSPALGAPLRGPRQT